MKKAFIISSMLLAGGIGIASASPAFAQGGPKADPWNFGDPAICGDSGTSLTGFGTYTDCEGMVTNPNNDVGGGNQPTLLEFLNGNLQDPNSSQTDPFDWLDGSTWLSAGAQIGSNGSNGIFSSSLGTSPQAGGEAGTWTFDLGDTTKTIEGLVISVKGAPGYSSYFFNTDALAGAINGTWDTLGLENNGGNKPALSHISAYYVLGDDVDPPEPEPVPEPAAMAGLMAVGAGIVINRRKKSQ